jgi:non-heme chloroperoxidase
VSLYPGVGHSPFWEDARRFNRELAAFAARCW